MRSRQLGVSGPTVGTFALGCMSMSPIYGTPDREDGIKTIRAALDAGITLFDTADFYGMGHNELLIAEALKGVSRDAFQLSVKFGSQRDPSGAVIGMDNSPAALKTALTYSLQRLSVDYLDVYRPARLDPKVPIEETMGAMADMVKAGYVRYVGLSEVGSDTIRRAAAVHPIVDLQIEYSLLSRGIEADILPTLRELGIGITAYSLLCRGLLSGGWQKDQPLDRNDWRRNNPRFQQGNIDRNLELVEALREIADSRGATVAQVAIAWVAAQGDDIVPMLGSRRPDQLAEALGATDFVLSVKNLAAIEAAIPKDAAAGDRYVEAAMAHLDSEK
ncbi:aldo/keto reductase [Sphingobium sp. SCG-1]|uniref:aldo/keto reductase n=1 Tax=Sphingobium sp. SCG-1 TaxID=2072936 RepID=UPI000CD67E0D|nr:aldo/keto reductase [Sphingobium sp. SCG-1]AUW57165.1 aldo/keto reductase [Sphingobium sp. SCG-1]